MIENKGRSDVLQLFLLEDDDDGLDVAIAHPRRSTGDTPVGRRASPLIRNTTDSNARELTPLRLSLEALSRRPRSNPRTRTPMRFESPLNSNAFRRDNSSPESPHRRRHQPFVGPLGSTSRTTSTLPSQLCRQLAEDNHHARRSFALGKSPKQRPSQRKRRRWNNDNFSGIALELAKSSLRGPAIAESLLIAQADAPKYRAIYNPLDCPQSAMSKLSEDNYFVDIRDKFFRGEIGHGPAVKQVPAKKEMDDTLVTPAIMMKRIHGRLRDVLIRACCNTAFSVEIVDLFEQCLIASFHKGKASSLHVVGTLLEQPTVTKDTTGQTTVRFYFDSESSTGGFHRLLLHAVCQFHGLNAVSTSVEFNGNSRSRLLSASGVRISGPHVRLVDHALPEKAQVSPVSNVFFISSELTALQI